MTSFLRFVGSGGPAAGLKLLVTATSARFRRAIPHPLRVITVSDESRGRESPLSGEAAIAALAVP
jgi:hypothetical protein